MNFEDYVKESDGLNESTDRGFQQISKDLRAVKDKIRDISRDQVKSDPNTKKAVDEFEDQYENMMKSMDKIQSRLKGGK